MATPFVVVNKATIKPGNLPCPGGDVDISFKASSAHVLLRAQYVLVGSAPYRFTAAPADARISPKGTSVTIDHETKKGGKKFTYSSGEMTLSRDDGEPCPGTHDAIALQVRVKQITKSGKISKKSRDAAGRIAIHSGALKAMHDASGKSKTAFSKELSAQLAAQGKKLSASAIQDAMAGANSTAKTNEILGSILK